MAVSTTRADALDPSTDLAQAGAVFNDATRLLDGGLWSKPADTAGQNNYLGSFLADIHAVLNDVTADLAPGATVMVGGNAYTLTAADVSTLQNVQTQLNTMLTEAPLSIGNSQHALAAQAALHAADAAVLAEINGDTGLATVLANNSYAGNTGATDVGFQNLHAGSDNAAALAAATAPGASMAQIGAVFNAATDLAVGGLNHSNMAEFNADMQAVATGLGNILNNPTQLAAIEVNETANAAALTTIHLQTLENQAEWQVNTVAREFVTNPNVAARSTNDNLLDMIDIVQNDGALNANAGGDGATVGSASAFGELPGYLTGTITQYQDNQAQTNFWAQFIAEANTLNNQLNAVANGTGTTALSTLITDIENYNGFGHSFAKTQGGIFGARFENELTQGTLAADSSAAVHGLQGILHGDTGAALAADKAQIIAAGTGFVADANDVGGNNIPLGGGSYVGTSTTVAGATSVAGIAQGSIPVGPGSGGHDPHDPFAGLGGGGHGGDHPWHWG